MSLPGGTLLLIHVVTFTWNAGAERPRIEALRGQLDRLASEIDDVLTLQHGPDLGIREGNGDYVLIATFKDEDGWRNYQAHPAHNAFVEDFVAPLQAHRVAAQILV